MAPSTPASITEHWLTLMTCTLCEHTPDCSPVYMCNLGHTLCLPCFRDMAKDGTPQCIKCMSTKFLKKDVSIDFLQKLKVKPGIGRVCRYPTHKSRSPSVSSSDREMKHKDETVTVEKLFQLPTDRLDQLFGRDNRTNMPVQQGAHPACRCCQKNTKKADSCEWMVNKFYARNTKPPMREVNGSSTSMSSRKPLNCPHKPCNKIIAMSSFHTHFKHEHTDIPRYTLDRGKELEIQLDTNILEFNTTFCLGLVTIYEANRLSMSKSSISSAANVARKFAQRIPIDTFWIMVSGSSESKKSHAFLIFWLFTNNDQFYNCTIEVASQKEEVCYSSFCCVNNMHDSYEVKDIVKRLNCLYLTYGSMESILSYGVKPKFRVTVH